MAQIDCVKCTVGVVVCVQSPGPGSRIEAVRVHAENGGPIKKKWRSHKPEAVQPCKSHTGLWPTTQDNRCHV